MVRMNKLLIIGMVLFVLSTSLVTAKPSTSATLEDNNNNWLVDNGVATLKLLGQTVLTITNYGWGVYWNLQGAVLENIYQIYAQQAYIGTVVIDSNYIAGMHPTNPFVISGRAGISLANNGVILEAPDNEIKNICVNDRGTIIICP